MAMCPPWRNDSPVFAAHHVDHYDFNVFHKTDGEYAVFTMTPVNSLEHWPLKYSYGIAKVDVVFCEVRLSLAFIPLEKHSAPCFGDRFSWYVHYVHTHPDCQACPGRRERYAGSSGRRRITVF
jgi:hypothetical protein